MQQVSLGDVIARSQASLKEGRPLDAIQFLEPALNQYPHNPALWFFYGYALNATGRKAGAALAWERSFELEPQAQVLANLGAAMRGSADPDGARIVLRKALSLIPDDLPTVANLVGTYVNEGRPLEAIELAEKYLGRGGEGSPQLDFNLALVNLEAGRFAEGFKLYARGHHEARDRRSYEGATPINPDNFAPAMGSRLIVYGEQGIGDELMFATMLDDIAADFEVTFDHHPRLGGLHETSPWAGRITRYPTRKTTPAWHKPGDADFYAPIGDLAQFYRTSSASFAWKGPYYRANPEEIATTRRYLDTMLNGRKLIGLSLRGGSLETARTYRTIEPAMLDPLLKREDLAFVALDYDDVSDVAAWIMATYGRDKYLWIPSITWAWDYHHKAALVGATDAIVTVCQSVAHLSAAMGHPTHVLTPARPAWRYGVREGSGDPWYLYPGGHAILHRQQGNDWTPAIAEALECLP